MITLDALPTLVNVLRSLCFNYCLRFDGHDYDFFSFPSTSVSALFTLSITISWFALFSLIVLRFFSLFLLFTLDLSRGPCFSF